MRALLGTRSRGGGGATALCASVVLLLATAASAAADTWSQLAPTGTPPAPRYDVGWNAYDVANDRLVIFSGDTGGLPRPQDVWILTDATGVGGTPSWVQLAPSGAPPFGRFGGSVGYAPGSNRIIVHGGCAANCGFALADTWVLTNANGLGGTPQWMPLPAVLPVNRAEHGAAYDPVSNRMIVFGGHQAFPGTNLNDVWVLTNADETGGIPTWVPLFPIGPPPTARQDFGTAYDVPNNRLIVFGGLENVASTTFSDVWILTNANGLGGTPQWIQLTPIGGPPLGRAAPVFQYDPVANRVILFGGSKVQGSPPIFLDEVWVLSGANGLAGTPQWTQLTPSGTPPAGRCCAASGYSTASNRLVLALGRNDEVAPFLFNDAWVLAFNEPPDCSGVTASPGTLWPPNHRLRLVTLSGATDPDGDPVTLTITGVAQDEPVSGLGGGDLSPDAQAGTQSNNVKVRSERSDTGDGRVYRISFTGSDGQGGTCSGTATVGVPHDIGPGATPVDSAPPSYNSFGP